MVRIQLNDRDMMRILTAAVRSIKADKKGAGCDRLGIERINCHDKNNTQEKVKEVNSRGIDDCADRDDHDHLRGQHLDRVSDSDI